MWKFCAVRVGTALLQNHFAFKVFCFFVFLFLMWNVPLSTKRPANKTKQPPIHPKVVVLFETLDNH